MDQVIVAPNSSIQIKFALECVNIDINFYFSLRCSVLLMRANATSSRSFIQPAMFNLELEWAVGVGGGGRAGRRPPEEAVEKQNTPWLRVTAFPRNEQATDQN